MTENNETGEKIQSLQDFPTSATRVARTAIPNAILNVICPTGSFDAGYHTLRMDQIEIIRIEGEPLVQIVNLLGYKVSSWVKAGSPAYKPGRSSFRLAHQA